MSTGDEEEIRKAGRCYVLPKENLPCATLYT